MKKKFQFKLDLQKKRFISTLIGSVLYFSGIISPMGLGQYSVYITSYFHYYNSKINIQLGNLMMPILILFLSLSSPLGGFFEHKIGFYLALIINSILLELIIFCFILQKNIYITFFLISLLGIVIGTVISIPGKNICLYYPNKKGIIMAMIGSSFMMFGAIINVIGEKIINPKKIIIKEGETFYPLNVAENYIKFYKLVLIIIPTFSIISLFLIKKYDPKYNDEQKQNLNSNNTSSDTKDANYSKNIKAAIFNSRIWKIAALSIFSQFVITFAGSTFRVYGALNSVNGSVMQYFPLFFALSSIIIGPIWGYINDKFQNFKIMKIISIFYIMHSIALTIFIKSNIIYIICIFLGSIFNSGINSKIQHHIMKIYGMKYYIEIGGVIGILGGIVNILKGALSFIISLYYHTGKDLQKAYRIVYLVGIGLNILGFYFASKEKEDPFIYPHQLENYNPDNKDISTNVNISQLSKNEIKIEK